MATWIFCNYCFQQPHRTSCFSLTSCGHVYCDVCLRKGRKDECLICKVPCRALSLSKHTDWDIQALFMRIDGLCSRYSRDTSQISEFQERHRKRLLTFYQEKISTLEDSLRRPVLQTQLQSTRSSQQTPIRTERHAILSKCKGIKWVGAPSANLDGRLLLAPDSSVANRAECMDVDLTPSPMRKPELTMGPARISLISPPQDGRMGIVSHRPTLRPRLMPTCSPVPQPLRPPALLLPSKASATPTVLESNRAGRLASPSPPSIYAPAPRLPISISGLLQRQHLGSSGLGGMVMER
ncbi:probable E3 SUMO-protein ligase RNF212 [Sorex fumeus]|uniref:probable E3 SUMO-protein ligase RNF212 n=1 Tax=Sorex fumeus TaxID=62283 RepID=UPI0024ADD1C0|nr:probable E3 SUMO-protein ligase RNF212 [Sorex fumeus]